MWRDWCKLISSIKRFYVVLMHDVCILWATLQNWKASHSISVPITLTFYTWYFGLQVSTAYEFMNNNIWINEIIKCIYFGIILILCFSTQYSSCLFRKDKFHIPLSFHSFEARGQKANAKCIKKQRRLAHFEGGKAPWTCHHIPTFEHPREKYVVGQKKLHWILLVWRKYIVPQ